MRPITIKLLSVAAATAISTGGAVAQNKPVMEHSKMDHSKMGHDAPAGANGSPAAKAFTEANAKMHKDMTITFSGNDDVDFVKGMLPHHQGAVDMAKIVLQYGKDPKVWKLAREIIKAQNTEIAFMNNWLAKKAK
jgi:uncharacterized protein (DUF305 family)